MLFAEKSGSAKRICKFDLRVHVASSGSPTVVTNRYVWGKDLSGTMHGAGGVGGLVAVSLGGEWYFPLYDHNGDVTEYIAPDGTVAAHYAYDAFGNLIDSSGSLSDSFRHRFSTKYFDSETGLYNYGYRFYSPILMRWLNRDHIGEDGGANIYAFCKNAPIFCTDYLGNTPMGDAFSKAYSSYDYIKMFQCPQRQIRLRCVLQSS